MIRRLISLLCALMLLMSLSLAQADTATETSANFEAFYRSQETTTYQGGVVLRGYLKGADTSAAPLEVAYAMTSAPYILLNQPTTWEITVSGGTGDYTCSAYLYRQTLDDMGNMYWEEDYLRVKGNTFEYTFTREGRYFWEFRIMDEGGEYISFQTNPYETYTQADETNPMTVVGKVNSIVDELITEDMSDYARALALHDWLIYNANYDYTYTHYDAAGVLLYGTGVCDSYARAYLMLCTAAGLDCLYIVGEAGHGSNWGSHAWNLVNLGGSWYYVDCTWDDPGEGGFERHDYFCVDDETLSADHRWNRPDNIIIGDGALPPDAEGGELEEDGTVYEQDYHFTFATVEEFGRQVDRMIAEGNLPETIYGKYTGNQNIYDIAYGPFGDWVAEAITQMMREGLLLPNSSYGYGVQYDCLFISLPWRTPSNAIHIAESTLRLAIGEATAITAATFSPKEDVFTWRSSNPAVATVSGSYDIEMGPVAVITGVAAGECTITVTGPSGVSDSIEVTVLPAHRPDFSLSAATDGDEVILSWEMIPGVTEYQIYRRYEGHDSLIGATASNRLRVSGEQLPGNVAQEVYVVGNRIVSGETQLTYTSTPITYGRMALTYAFTLPASLTRIEEEAFEGCTHLTSVKIPGKVTYIGEDAFEECVNLTTVRIPASVRYIGEDAFEDCPLQYAEVSPGSYAEEWLLRHFPDITLVY